MARTARRKPRFINLDVAVPPADCDKGGSLLAFEFAEPESTNLSLMGELARKLHIPQLRVFDVAQFPTEVEEQTVTA